MNLRKAVVVALGAVVVSMTGVQAVRAQGEAGIAPMTPTVITISGRVTLRLIGPANGATVRVKTTTGQEVGVATSGANGKYTVANVPASDVNYKVSVDDLTLGGVIYKFRPVFREVPGWLNSININFTGLAL